MDDHRQTDGNDNSAPVTQGDWLRGIIVVLLVTLAFVAGGLWILGHTIGGCGAAVPC
jgi:hypothetical protein